MVPFDPSKVEHGKKLEPISCVGTIFFVARPKKIFFLGLPKDPAILCYNLSFFRHKLAKSHYSISNPFLFTLFFFCLFHAILLLPNKRNSHG